MLKELGMISPLNLAEAYNRNVLIVHRECEGISHVQSLLQPQPRGNCLNWVVGHLLTGRNDVLRALNSPFLVDEEELAPYKRESEPIAGEGEGIIQLETLLEYLKEGQQHISALMPLLTEADGNREVYSVVTERTTLLSKLVFFHYFHDCYHVGQTSYLRQLAGKDDKII
jgi:hypothetical protein